MAGRSVGSLWKCRYCALGSSSQTWKQIRTFTSSTTFQRHAGIPSFSETSSPELDTLLSQFRTKVFLPAHLSEEHKSLIYREKHKRLLQDDPVTIQISGESFRLEHIDRKYDLPSHTKGIFQAISLMKSRRDWLNLAPLLAGYYRSPNKLTEEQKERVVRKVGKAGRVDVLLECARRVDFTGFTLDSPYIVAEIAWYAQNKVADGWLKRSTEKTLSIVEEISYLLEDKRHSGGLKAGKRDPRIRPELIGVLLQLSAALSVKYHDCKDVDGRVKKYAERLRAVVEAGEDILENGICNKWGEDHFYLYRVVPVVYGIQLAQKVLTDPNSSLTYWLGAQAKVFGDAAESSYKKLSEEAGDERKGLRSLDCYKRLLSENSKL